MALHIKCFEVRTEKSVLYATMQYGPVKYPAAKKGEKAQEGLGVKVRLSRKLERHGSVEQPLGHALLNLAGELVHIPKEAELTDGEVRQLEAEIKEMAQ